MNLKEKSLEAHQKIRGKISLNLKANIDTVDDLSLYYSPGVAYPCEAIKENPDHVNTYTWRGNTVAIISDGSAVLGLGDIGPEASLPVMEGKAVLFKRFADIDAIPIVLNTKDVEEIVNTICAIAPSFAGINLEDISAPRCVEIEKKLIERLPIPVFHDDQHGTAIAVLSGLISALKVVGKSLDNLRVVVSGAGAAGSAIIKLLLDYGIREIIAFDANGILSADKPTQDPLVAELSLITNPNKYNYSLEEALVGSDVFIGVSVGNIVTKEMIAKMNHDAIVFPLANPRPEIPYEDALEAGARIIATGRSDYPNQINNVLVFPGLFRGILDSKAKYIPASIKVKVAKAIANLIEEDVSETYIIPHCFDERVATTIRDVVIEEIEKLRSVGTDI